MGCSKLTGILSEVHVGVVCVNEYGFPIGSPGELVTVTVLQSEPLVSEQSGWEHGVLPDLEDFS